MNKISSRLLFLLLFFIPSVTFAQGVEVKGVIREREGDKIEHVSVVATSLKSGLKKHTVSDKEGSFILHLTRGEYKVLFTLLGYRDIEVNVVVKGEGVNFNEVVMEEEAQLLEGAVVTDSRITFNAIGYDINLKNNPLFAEKALPEILNLSPGINATGSSLTLYGDRVIDLYIDHRRVRMSGDELLFFLNSFKGKELDKLEIITTAPPKYGVGAVGRPIIRIVTTKEQGGRATFQVRGGGNSSKTILSPMASVMHRRGKLSVYGDVTYLNMALKNDIDLIEREGSEVRESLQSNRSIVPLSIRSTVGLGYDLTKEDFIAVEYFGRNLHRIARQKSDLFTLERESKTVDNNLLAKYERKMKNSSSLELSMDIGSASIDNSLVDNLSSYSLLNSRAFLNLKGDYSTSFFGRRDKFSGGVLYSNLFDSYNSTLAHYEAYRYEEHLASLYLSYSYSFDKVDITASAVGTENRINERGYFKVTPTVGLTYHLNKRKGHLTTLNFRRGYSRPRASHLNPIPLVGDSQFITVGNPDLQPYITNQLNYRLTLKRNYTFALTYSYREDMFTPLFYQEGEMLYRKFINGVDGHNFGGSFHVSAMPSRWLMFNASVGVGHERLHYGEEIIASTVGSYDAFIVLTLPKQFNINIVAVGKIGRSSGVNSTLNDPLFITLDFSKSFAQNRFKVAFEISDPINSDGRRSVITNIDGMEREVRYRTNATSFSLSLSSNLRWGLVRARAKRAGKASELRGRISD